MTFTQQNTKGKMTAMADWVIVEKFEPDSTTASGIIVNSSEDPDLGRVISVGPDAAFIKPGMVVAPDWSKAVLVRHLTCAVRLTDIIAIVEEQQATPPSA
jgi:hypothetical protein